MSRRHPTAAARQTGRTDGAQTQAGNQLDHALTLLAEAERVAQIGSWEWDIQGNIVTWSDELYHLLGVDPATLRTTFEGGLELVHPDDRDFLKATIERARREGRPYVCEHRIVRRSDGAVRTWQSRGRLVVDAQGQPMKVVGTGQDITARTQLEEALARYAAVIQSSEDAIVTKTLTGTILSWNPGAERLYGYRAEEVEGHPISILFPTDRRDECERVLERVRRGEHVEHHETVRVRRDGSRVHVSVSVSPIKDPAGRIIGASFIARDITERRQVAEALARSRSQLQAFAGRLRAARETERSQIAREIHDELGQALTALKMDLFTLKNGIPQALMGKADGMAALIDQMVDKVRTLASDLRPAVLDNLGLVAAVEWTVRQFAQRTGIRCSLDLPPEQIGLDVERSTDIFRILQEALTNIVRHAAATEVVVHLRTTPCELVLEVHDNGRGITEAETVDAQSFGLLGIRERALSCGGEVGVGASPHGGTSVTLCIPLGHGRPGAVA
jgi:PAS domain S-box-containing protein